MGFHNIFERAKTLTKTIDKIIKKVEACPTYKHPLYIKFSTALEDGVLEIFSIFEKSRVLPIIDSYSSLGQTIIEEVKTKPLSYSFKYYPPPLYSKIFIIWSLIT